MMSLVIRQNHYYEAMQSQSLACFKSVDTLSPTHLYNWSSLSCYYCWVLKYLLLWLVPHCLCVLWQMFSMCCITKATPINFTNGKCWLKKLRSCRTDLLVITDTFHTSCYWCPQGQALIPTNPCMPLCMHMHAHLQMHAHTHKHIHTNTYTIIYTPVY